MSLNYSKRHNVLFIPAWYPSAENPTAGTFVREHARAVSLFDDVTVLHIQPVSPFHGRDRLSWREEIDEGIHTIRVRLPHIKAVSYTLGVMAAYYRLARRGYRPDVIHPHVYLAGAPALLIGKLHHLPVVVTEHFTEFPRRTLSKVRIRQAQIAFRWADTVMPVSRCLQHAIESYGIRANFKVVPNVVDTALFHPLSGQTKRSTERLLFVGLLDPSHKKGVPHLLRALAQLRQRRDDWQLDIVGDGPARAEYQRMTADLGLSDKIIFHGLKSKPEVAQFMHGTDLFVLPSLFETFSVATAEALATGTPVIATRCGGPEDFVTPEVGLLVPPGDTEALADAIDWMLANHDRYDPTAVAAYAHGRFSHEAVGMQLHEIYRESVAGT
jgi:glycosyltransferase involved in cell wall biosynthesis